MSNAAIFWNGREGGRDKKYHSISETVGDDVTHYLKRERWSREICEMMDGMKLTVKCNIHCPDKFHKMC